jgi:tectonic-1/3
MRLLYALLSSGCLYLPRVAYVISDTATDVIPWALVSEPLSSNLPVGCVCKEDGVVETECEKFECTCTCDITAGSCDYGCCCDSECSTTVVRTFESLGVCKPTGPAPSSVTKCYSTAELVTVNPHYPMSGTRTVALSLDAVLCVQAENTAYLGQFYDSTSAPSTQVRGYEETYGTTYPLFAEMANNRQYFQNDSLLVLHGSSAWLPLPLADFSGACNDNNYVQFDVPVSQRSCVRNINSTADCVAVLGVDAYARAITVKNNPASTAAYNISLEIVYYYNWETGAYTNITELFLTSSCKTFSASDNVSMSACNFGKLDDAVDICYNVVKEVQYSITTAAQQSVDAAAAFVVVTDLRFGEGSANIEQTFAVDFHSADNVTRSATKGNLVDFTRSGNPGYLIGRPVRAGRLQSNATLHLQAISTFEIGFHVPGPSSTGQCRVNSTTQVLFGYDFRTGCYITYTKAELEAFCMSVQSQGAVQSYFLGYTEMYVGYFGNADPTDTAQWFQPTVLPIPAITTTWNADSCACTDIVSSLNYRFYYASVGHKGNPQNKITDITIGIDRQDWVYSRRDSSSQRFELVVDVSFIDVTAGSTSYTPPAPPGLFSVPYDVFYPFQISSALMLRPQYPIVWVAILANHGFLFSD